MTRDPRERARLRYIRQSIARIEQYTHGGREAFLSESLVQDAVRRRLETLADAIGKLSDSLKGAASYDPMAAGIRLPKRRRSCVRGDRSHASVGNR